jgi:pimeloyl-ACP methyl ester carboxylesterase
MPRLHSPRLLVLPLLLRILAGPAAFADDPGVRIEGPPAAVVASEDAKWRIPIKVINDLGVGILGDSLTCEVDDLDPGITGAGRHFQGTSSVVSQVMKSLGQRDSTTITFTALASCERARLTFRLNVHSSEGKPYQATCHVETAPSLVARSFPSSFIADKAGRIETVLIGERWPQSRSPAILLVHPENSHARRMIPVAWSLSNAGYAVMSVSLPGYGQSTGPADFGGPSSVRALGLALDALRRSPQVDSTRVAVWGISRGATAAAMLASQRRDLTALVLQSGVFDPASAYRTSKSDSMRHALDKEGKTSGGWNARSSLRVANRIKVPVLFVHGERDSEAVSNQSVDLAGKLRAQGGEVQVQIVPGVGHAVPSAASYPLVTGFLKPYLKPTK